MRGVQGNNATGVSQSNMDWAKVNYVKLAEDDTKLKEFWVTSFQETPQMLYDLLYDIVALKNNKLSKNRRRAMEGSLDDIWNAVFGEDKA